jgi:hypothetical protein
MTTNQISGSNNINSNHGNEKDHALKVMANHEGNGIAEIRKHPNRQTQKSNGNEINNR